MKYICWKKEERNCCDPDWKGMGIPPEDKKKIVEIYIFENPKIIHYPGKCNGVRPNGGNYFHWYLEEGALIKNSDKFLCGIGIEKDCLCKLDKNFDLTKISKKIGVGEKQLETILSNQIH
tara:strand:+ start:286 stop:645 length:360 start_codon:yes stop_codon:yes gene_type:complete